MIMATFVRSVLRYIEPFYPATAEEQGRLQRWFLGDAEDEVDDTTGADGELLECFPSSLGTCANQIHASSA